MRYSSSRLVLFLLLIIIPAGCSSQKAEPSPPQQSPQVIAANEIAAMARLRSIATAEALYMVESGDRYATLEELTKKGLVNDPARGKLTGYSFEVRVKAGGFEATAVPVEPGISGKRSFYIDETNVLRGAERQGAKATSTDREV
jgi:hypothetical protein